MNDTFVLLISCQVVVLVSVTMTYSRVSVQLEVGFGTLQSRRMVVNSSNNIGRPVGGRNTKQCNISDSHRVSPDHEMKLSIAWHDALRSTSMILDLGSTSKISVLQRAHLLILGQKSPRAQVLDSHVRDRCKWSRVGYASESQTLRRYPKD